MFWTGVAVGIFLGAAIGMVVASLVAASGRDYAEAYLWPTPANPAKTDRAVQRGTPLPAADPSAVQLHRYLH